jgi:flagellar motility protein MotE (MotC chaperone)
VFKLIVFTFALAAGGGAQEPTPPTPPAGPTAPKEPEAPTAHKGEGVAKGEAAKGQPAAEKPSEKAGTEKASTEKPAGEKAASAEKPAGKPEKRAAGKSARNGSAPPPPSITGSALRQEIKQNGGEDRGAAPLSERARLEQLAADINRAREALKQDTARLETMLKNGGGGDLRMPLGDPTEPVASPGGPAASKEAMKEQILTVSKAMKGMKPEQAAAIISRLDRVLASEILRRMKPADAGAVMASIKPELAAELATAIATRKSMVDGDLKGAKR